MSGGGNDLGGCSIIILGFMVMPLVGVIFSPVLEAMAQPGVITDSAGSGAIVLFVIALMVICVVTIIYIGTNNLK